MLVKPSKISIGHTEVILREDGIIEVIASNHTYDANNVKAIHSAINELRGDEKAPLLIITSDYTSFNNEAKEYLIKDDASSYSIAKAFVIKSIAQRVLMNAIISIRNKSVKRKFFTETSSAIDWLNECRKNTSK